MTRKELCNTKQIAVQRIAWNKGLRFFPALSSADVAVSPAPEGDAATIILRLVLFGFAARMQDLCFLADTKPMVLPLALKDAILLTPAV